VINRTIILVNAAAAVPLSDAGANSNHLVPAVDGTRRRQSFVNQPPARREELDTRCEQHPSAFSLVAGQRL